MEVFQMSGEITSFPYIKKSKYTKDFSWGFYCTKLKEQADKWAYRHNGRIVNVYDYKENMDEYLAFKEDKVAYQNQYFLKEDFRSP